VIRVINKGGWETEHYEAVQLQWEEIKIKVRYRSKIKVRYRSAQSRRFFPFENLLSAENENKKLIKLPKVANNPYKEHANHPIIGTIRTFIVDLFTKE
jgi:hypothetical protein